MNSAGNLQWTLLVLIFLSSEVFAQNTHEWNVGRDTMISIVKGDKIRFVPNLMDEEYNALTPLSKREITSIQDGILLIDEPFIEMFGDGNILIESVAKKTKLEASVEENGLGNEETQPNTEGKSVVRSKSIVHDAIALKENFDDGCIVSRILENYGIDDQNALDPSNSFLTDVGFSLSCGSPQANLLPNAFSKAGGADVTKFAGGLAKFIVKRAKEELTVEFFNDFKEVVNAPENEDFRILFPSTTSTLLLIDDEVYNFQRYIGTLREQFEADINLLAENLQIIVETRHQGYFGTEEGEKVKAMLISGFDVIIGIRDKEHPGEIIESFNVSNYAAFDSTLAGAIETIQLISESIRESESNNEDQYWVDKSVFREVIDDTTTLKIYLGLLVQVAKKKKITFGKGQELAEILDDLYEDYLELKPYLKSLANNIQTINTLVKASNDDQQKLSVDYLSRYVNATNGIFKSVNPILKKFESESIDFEKLGRNLNSLAGILDQAGKLYTNVNDKKYSAAITNLTLLYQSIQDQEGEEQLILIKKYGPFLAAMLQAENSDDVAAVIEAYALPSGSARIKKNSKFNVSLNSYVGGFVGVEDATGVAGITAPAGVGFNWGTKKKRSFSIFVSLIDIGAITAFRFEDDNSEVAPIYLREIVSPGGFLSFGFKKPFSINLGVQRASLLTRVGSGSNEVDLEHNIRFSASFVVDIPLWNIYTQPR